MIEFRFMSRLSLFALLLVVISVGSALAHGKENHSEKTKMDQHMQAMMAVKDQVPQDYRVMERTPILPEAESLARGKELFGTNCTVCHGENGDGKGPAALSLTPPPANFLEKKHSAMYGPGEKYWIIGNGTGKTGMPPFPQLTPIERWHLVNYIFYLQEKNQ
jgi:mono/diheme cytochrome c family protein